MTTKIAPSEDQNRIGVQIREARRTRGWTQTKLAAYASLSRNMIGRYERGDDVPTLITLPRLLSVLECSLKIGEHTVSVRGPVPQDVALQPKQGTLDYEQEYTCQLTADTALKIRPANEGLFITAQRRKRA